MALSNSFSFSVTCTDIIRESMLNVGAIGEAEVPTAQEFTDCQRKLNMLVKQWMGTQDFAPGLKMWERARGDLFLSSSKGVYQLGPTGDNFAAAVATSTDPSITFQTNQLTQAAAGAAATLYFAAITNFTVGDFLVVQLDSGDIYSSTVGAVNSGAKTVTLGNSNTLPSSSAVGSYVWNFTQKGQRPLGIVTCVLRDSQSTDIPMNLMTLQDYELLPNKTSAQYLQDPTAWYYESQIGSQLNVPVITGPGELYLDIGGAQDVTKHLHMVWIRPVMDFVNPGDNPEYPQQWYRALCWGLSREICSMFDAEWTQDMNSNLTEALAMARQADVETTTLYFEVDADIP
jgi:hypothetical protein